MHGCNGEGVNIYRTIKISYLASYICIATYSVGILTIQLLRKFGW